MLRVRPASMSSAPVAESKETSSPQWKPPRSKGSGAVPWTVTMVVSGRRMASANFVNEAAVSPRPWSRRRMFGAGDVDWEGEGGAGVTVMVSSDGKSDGAGVLVGILN